MLDIRNSFGKRCELIAAEWLLSQGCYVYAPFVEQGPVDLIALSAGNQWFYFDVKKVGRRKALARLILAFNDLTMYSSIVPLQSKSTYVTDFF